MTKQKNAAPCPVVIYCGPTIAGVAKQYTVYKGELPPALKEAISALPAMKELIFPLERLPEVRQQLNSKSGHIYRLYKVVQAKF